MSINSMTSDAIERMYPDLKGRFTMNRDGINGMTDRAIEQMNGPHVPPGSGNDAFLGSVPENPGIMSRPLTVDAAPEPGPKMTVDDTQIEIDGFKLRIHQAQCPGYATPGAPDRARPPILTPERAGLQR